MPIAIAIVMLTVAALILAVTRASVAEVPRCKTCQSGVTAIIGILIGLPTLRLRGDYLAIVTLGFGEILPQVANNGDSLGGFNLTNGPNGITPGATEFTVISGASAFASARVSMITPAFDAQ